MIGCHATVQGEHLQGTGRVGGSTGWTGVRPGVGAALAGHLGPAIGGLPLSMALEGLSENGATMQPFYPAPGESPALVLPFAPKGLMGGRPLLFALFPHQNLGDKPPLCPLPSLFDGLKCVN